MFKRITSLLLAVVMVLGMVPVTAGAEETIPEATVAETAVVETTEAVTEPVETENTTVSTEISAEPMEEVQEPTVATTVAEEEETVPVEDTAEPTEEIVASEEVTLPVVEPTEEVIVAGALENASQEAAYAVAASGTCGENLTWELSDDGVLTISGTGAMTEYQTREQVPWNSYRSEITSVVVEDDVTSIGGYAFYDCTKLKKIDLPDSVISIGTSAFKRCTALTAVVFPQNIASIGKSSFEDCQSLTEVEIPKTITVVSSYAFCGCMKLAQITIPTGITTIEDGAFSSTDITEIIIPSSVTSMGTSVFRGCDKLTYITIPGNVGDIGNWTFEGCTGLASVTISNGVKTIGKQAFEGCTALTEVTIPDSVTSLGEAAFYGCSGLVNVKIGNGVAAIQKNTFSFCSGLKDLTFGSGITSIGEKAFEGCRLLTAVRLPDKLTTLGSRVFADCIDLRAVYIPDSVTSIPTETENNGPFYLSARYSRSLVLFCEAASKPSGWGIYWNNFTAGTTLHAKWGVSETEFNFWAKDAQKAEVVIPSYITEIHPNAFYERTDLTKVTIPDSVTSIGSYAFDGCTGLNAVTIPDNVTTIAPYAFSDCTGLTTVDIPDNVITIPADAFSRCTGLTSVTVGKGVTNISTSAFDDCTALTGIWVDSANKTYATASGALLNKVGTKLIWLPQGFTGTYEVPETVSEFQGGAFSDCTGLTEIYFHGNAPTCYTSVFYNVTATAYYPTGNSTWTDAVRNRYGGTITWKTWSPLSVQTLPDKVIYSVGDAIDLTGLVLKLEKQDGTTQTIAEGYTLVSGDTSVSGRITVTVSYGGYTTTFEIGVHTGTVGLFLQDSVGYPESEHNYPNDARKTYTYTVENAAYLELTFSKYTETEDGYDYIKIYDAADNLLGEYTGTELAGKTITVPGDTVEIYLRSDEDNSKYGFDLTRIYAYIEDITHVKTDSSPYTEHTCTEDGYYTHTCYICGYSWTESVVGTATHTMDQGTYTEPTCTADGYTTYKCLYCTYSTVTQDSGTAQGHSWDRTAGVYTEPRCFVDGYTTYTCTACGATEDEADTGTARHNFVDGSCADCGVASTVQRGGWINDTVYWAMFPGYRLYIGGTGTVEKGDWHKYVTTATVMVIGDGITNIGENAFQKMTSLDYVYIPKSVIRIGAGVYFASPFYECDSFLKIYCEVDDEPSGWQDKWNYRANTGASLTTYYGTTLTDFDFLLTIDTTATVIEIPDNVTTIPNAAFANCNNLRYLYIPASVTKINSPLLSSYTANSGVRVFSGAASKPIGWNSNWNSNKIKAASFGVSLEEFRFWKTLSETADSVTIPEGITRIPEDVFTGFTNLASVNIPDSVISVGRYAFNGCTKLKHVVLGAGVQSIDKYTFSGCTALETVYIPESVAIIYSDYGSGPFHGCASTLEIYCAAEAPLSGWGTFWDTYSYSYTLMVYYGMSMEDYNFWRTLDSSSTSVKIPEGTSRIPDSAFRNFTKLTSVTIPDSVITIGKNAFAGCNALAELVIPEGVTTIEQGAFSGCSGLISVTIPESLTNIKDDAFAGCSALQQIHVQNLYDWFAISFASSDANPLSNKGSLYVKGQKVTDLVIPEDVTAIPAYAFYGYADLTGVTFLSGVESVGTSAFAGCENLTAVKIADVASWCGIQFASGDANPLCYGGLYLNGQKVTELVIPDGVAAIGDYSFYKCAALTSVTVPAGIESVGKYAFYGCEGLTAVHVRDLASWCSLEFNYNNANPLYYAKKLYQNGQEVTDLVVPAGVETIGSYAFYNCSSLKSVTLDSNVKQIGSDAFAYCTGLAELNLSEKLETIGSSAFYYCKELTSLTIPASVTSIGYSIVGSGSKITEIRFLGGAPYINSSAFSGITAKAYYRYDQGWENDQMKSYGGTLTWESYTAEEIVAQGTCTDGLTWLLEKDGTLWLDGSGTMANYSVSSGKTTAPWGAYVGSITEVVVDKEITRLGNYAFYGCSGLTKIRFLGAKPELFSYAFAGVRAEAEYRANDTTWVPDELGNYGGTITWVPVGMSEEYLGYSDLTITDQYWRLDCAGNLTVHNWDYTYNSYYGTPWHPYRNHIKTLTVTGYEKIGSYYYYGLEELTTVIIRGTFSSIGNSAFENCTKLMFVDLGNQISHIGNSAFYRCSALESIFLPPWTSCNIGDYAFEGCTALKQVALYDVTTLGEYVFRNCPALKKVYINNFGLGHSFSAKDTSFSGVNATVYYPRNTWESLTTQKSYGGSLTWTEADFGVCGIDTTWNFAPDTGVLTIAGIGEISSAYRAGSRMPWGNFRDEILSIRVEKNITYLPCYTFENCRQVTTVTLPESLTDIDLNAFQGCVKLNNLILPSSLKLIGRDTGSSSTSFSGCTALTDVYYFGTEEEWTTVENADQVNKTMHFLVLDRKDPTCTATGIQPHYHYDDTSVYDTLYDLARKPMTGSITIPELGHDMDSWSTVTAATCTVDGQQRRDCSRCDHFEEKAISANGHNFTDKTCVVCGLPEGMDYTVNNGQITITGSESTDTNLVIPAEIDNKPVTGIDESAFADRDDLTTITIPDSVTDIGENAFSGCSGLTDIYYEGNMEQWLGLGENIPEADYIHYSCESADNHWAAITVDATCTAEGYTCDACNCGYERNKVITAPMLGHMDAIDEAVAATCTTTGLTEGKHCSVCKEVLVAQTVIPFTGHTTVTDKAVPATCTETGLTEGKHCSVCSEVLVAQTETDALGHDYRQKDDYFICSRCEGTTTLAITQEYILLRIGETFDLTSIISPATVAGSVKWNVDGKELTGSKFKAEKTGTFSVTAELGGIQSIPCRIDVAKASVVMDTIQLNSTALTTEIYSTRYTEVDVLLQLPQNLDPYVASQTASAAAVGAADPGKAIQRVTFTNAAVANLFELILKDDRTALIVPKDSTIANPALAAKKYTTAIRVVGKGFDCTSENMTLTVKKTMPKLKATISAFNSFESGQSQEILITGGTVETIQANTLPSWLTLDGNMLKLNKNAPQRSISGKASLLVKTEEWAIPASVSLSVKNTYKAPKLKLDTTSVTIPEQKAKEELTLSLLCTNKKDTLAALKVTNVTAPKGYSVDYREDGSFTLTANNGFKKGTVMLTVHFDGTSATVSLKLTVKMTAKVTPVKLKLSASKLTLNKAIGDSAVVTVTNATRNLVYQLMDKSGKNPAEGKLDLLYNGGKLTVKTNEKTEYGATYKLLLKPGETGAATTLTVTIPAQTKSSVTVAIKASGKLDVIRDAGTFITVTPTYKNCVGQIQWNERLEIYSSADNYKKAVTNQFCVASNGAGGYTIRKADGKQPSHSYKYKVKLVGTYGKTRVESPLVSMSVTMGSSKLTAQAVTMFARDKYDQAWIRLTPSDAKLNDIARVEIKDAKYRDMFEIIDYGNGQFAVEFKNNKIHQKLIGKKATTKVSVTLNIFLDGNQTTKANTTAKLSLTVVK